MSFKPVKLYAGCDTADTGGVSRRVGRCDRTGDVSGGVGSPSYGARAADTAPGQGRQHCCLRVSWNINYNIQ